MSDTPTTETPVLLRVFKVLYGIYTVIMFLWAVLYIPAILFPHISIHHDFRPILMTTNGYLVCSFIWAGIAVFAWFRGYVKSVPRDYQ